jgi:UDP:flavonoid glycosyltransferase YjiC (YdhE family)
MSKKKVLFISGSLGLGHVGRDLVIAQYLRQSCPGADISWLAAHPATDFLVNAGEKLAPEVVGYANDNDAAEMAAENGRLNILKYLTIARKAWKQNVKVFAETTNRERFDLTIGDETYEIAVALSKNPHLKKTPFVMIYDFIGLDSMTSSPLERLGIYIWNRTWATTDKKGTISDLNLFIGEKEDIPDKPFGFMLPNRRDWAQQRCQFVGYVIPFDPNEYTDQLKVKAQLGYEREQPLIIGSVGGSAAGKPLLEIFGKTYPLIKDRLSDLRMRLVCGPRINSESIVVPQGVEVMGYVPDLYKHFAASDLALVMGGGTSTLELTVLKRPFIYFPLEEHCEQELNVAARLERHRSGVRMSYSKTTPKILAEKIIANIGKEVGYASVPTDGGKKSAELISKLL